MPEKIDHEVLSKVFKTLERTKACPDESCLGCQAKTFLYQEDIGLITIMAVYFKYREEGISEPEQIANSLAAGIELGIKYERLVNGTHSQVQTSDTGRKED